MKRRRLLWAILYMAAGVITGVLAGTVGYPVYQALNEPYRPLPANYDPLPHADVRIPFEYIDGKVFVPISINGETIKAQLDTGAPRSYIDTERAQALGLRPRPSNILVNGQPAQLLSSHDIRIGGYRLPALKATQLGKPTDPGFSPVLLGVDGLLTHRVVEFDFRKRHLILHRRKGFKPPAEAKEVALSGTGRGPYAMPVSVNGAAPIMAMVDMGNSSYPLWLSDAAAKAAGLKPKPGVVLKGGLPTIPTTNWLAVGEYNLAGFVNRNANIVIAEPGQKHYFDHVEGNIGALLLAEFHSWMDFGAGRMWLIRPPRYEIGVPFERVGGGATGYPVEPVQPELETISGVRPGSPARKAGLKGGDRILTVNGQPSKIFWPSRDPASPAPMSLVMSDGRRLTVQPVDVNR